MNYSNLKNLIFTYSDRMAEVKGWLNNYLQKEQKQLSTSIQPCGGRGRTRFKCELRVTGIPYIGVGNSTSKKDASSNAAYDFCQYLIRQGTLNKADFPFDQPVATDAAAAMNENMVSGPPAGGYGQLPGGRHVPRPQSEGQFGGYGQYGAGASSEGQNLQRWQQQQQDRQAAFDARTAQETANAEQVDLTANLHGGWTHENGKKKLNEFCQQNKIRQPEFVYRPFGPDNQRSFYAECSIFIPRISQTIKAREHGSNKDRSIIVFRKGLLFSLKYS